jgi:hypothetical protein
MRGLPFRETGAQRKPENTGCETEDEESLPAKADDDRGLCSVHVQARKLFNEHESRLGSSNSSGSH